MAPSKEACAVAMAMAAPFLAMASNIGGNVEKRRRTSIDALQRTVSDVSYELHHHVGAKGTTMMEEEEAAAAAAAKPHQQLHPVAEVEDARCECCGMSEECTPEYIREVRGRFSGRWVCGLCAEAVTEEADKNGGEREEALRAHMAVCKRFNGFGRTHPVLFQAEAMREILRKRSKLGPRSRSSIDAREVRQSSASNAAASSSGGIARSSSCMPFITDEFSHRVNIN
ncbi:hypothetical protein GUJ93_ZPchr0006g42255 [Zizania palustris]|uniref:DUF1677 family protein n=1 Tax=Zizania palustris TaxID=103762 RepID=A0A8J5W3B6_ZIZPA|nr:hypothetical protein GUJ93_ZPchr0006g42255 [Zizania palustris]